MRSISICWNLLSFASFLQIICIWNRRLATAQSIAGGNRVLENELWWFQSDVTKVVSAIIPPKSLNEIIKKLDYFVDESSSKGKTSATQIMSSSSIIKYLSERITLGLKRYGVDKLLLLSWEKSFEEEARTIVATLLAPLFIGGVGGVVLTVPTVIVVSLFFFPIAILLLYISL